MAGTLSRKDREPRKIRYNKKTRKARQGGPANLERRKIVRQGGPANPNGKQNFQKSKAHVSESEGGSANFNRQNKQNQEEQNLRKARQGGPA